MSVALLTRGYITDNPVVNDICVSTIISDPGDMSATAMETQDTTIIVDLQVNTNIKSDDTDAEILGIDDSATIKIIPCD